MKCVDYFQSWDAIQEIHQKNTSIYNHLIECFESATNSLGKLSQAVKSIRLNLPTQRKRSGIFQKLKGRIDFSNAEKSFTEQWMSIATDLLTLPNFPSIFNTEFTTKIKDEWKKYEDAFKEIESRYKQALDKASKDTETHKSSIAEYESFCQQIEDARASQSEKFQAIRAEYQKVANKALDSTDSYNDSVIENTIVIEQCLLDFEEADKARSDSFAALFKELQTSYESWSRSSSEFMTSLRTRVDAISTSVDVESSLPDFQKPETHVQISDEIPAFDFDVSQFVDVHAVFEESSKLAKLKEDCGRLRSGETVSIVEENEQGDVKVMNVLHEVFVITSDKLE